MALINALAHVIVTEKLMDEEFVNDRCDIASFAKWETFIAQEHNSPEATEAITGVPATELRKRLDFMPQPIMAPFIMGWVLLSTVKALQWLSA